MVDAAAPVILEAEHLSKRFGAVTALTDVSLRLHRGEVLGLVVLDQLPQHRDEDVDGMRGLAFGTAQAAAAHRVIRAVHLRTAVDQK